MRGVGEGLQTFMKGEKVAFSADKEEKRGVTRTDGRVETLGMGTMQAETLC